MDQTYEENTILKIVNEIKKSGYDPYDQLTGYLLTGDEKYITRSGGARDLIKTIDRQRLKEYLDTRVNM